MATGLLAFGQASSNQVVYKYTPDSTAKLIVNLTGSASFLIGGETSLTATANTSVCATIYLAAGTEFVFSIGVSLTGGGYIISALEESS